MLLLAFLLPLAQRVAVAAGEAEAGEADGDAPGRCGADNPRQAIEVGPRHGGFLLDDAVRLSNGPRPSGRPTGEPLSLQVVRSWAPGVRCGVNGGPIRPAPA
jgi:hypothetical protein